MTLPNQPMQGVPLSNLPPANLPAATALVADDEPLLAQGLARRLREKWPVLNVLPPCGDGPSALQAALQHLPDLVFLDIRMPGMDGLETAQAIVEGWPDNRPLPLIAFVTAYNDYAVQAFEHAAADYLVKPVSDERLAKAVDRLAQALRNRTSAEPALLAALRQLIAGQGDSAAGVSAGVAGPSQIAGARTQSPASRVA
jgi:DNA-binding LytR/AlgR family response regulator